MRVVGGDARGCRLNAPSGMDTRPTLDRVKEAVFSILYPYLKDALVLDLFAGSGAMGIEALSRKAAFCRFVDSDKKAYDCVLDNLKKTKLIDKSEVCLSTYEKFLRGRKEEYDIVFLDPPYDKGLENGAFEMLKDKVGSGGVVVLETQYVPGDFDGFEIIKHRKYGRVFITVYKRMV